MAEVVAFGASVVAFIQLADRVVEITKYYIEAIKDCPSDLKAILVEVSLLRAVLHSLEFVLQANKDDSTGPTFLGHLAGADGPIEMCRKALVALEKLLPCDFHAARGKRQKVRSAAAHLAWPLRESSAKKLLDSLSRYRASITFAITCDVMRDIKDIQQDVRQLNERFDSSTVSDFCNWLESTNPSTNHNSAWELREDNTGLWMTDSEEWEKWLEGKERFLWIHGIPGAGKTVLASYLVEQVRLYCQNPAPTGQPISLISPTTKPTISVYYYCYFARNQDEAAHFLRWLLGQLCRRVRVIPNDIHAFYKSSNLPSISLLLEAVSAVLQRFQTVFVLIDAVDESCQRHNLLKVLRDLVTDHRFNGIRLLATSREYYDIETCFASLSKPISMDNPIVEADIGRFVHSALLSNIRFKTWPSSLIQQVEKALTKGAKGMFRWAVCQIDILQRLRSREKVQEAISCLPRTLDETYERIFRLLPDEDVQFVRYALMYICTNNDARPVPIHAAVLLQAIAFRLESSSRSGTIKHDDFYNIDTLRDTCGCLITFSGHQSARRVSLAHYTVKEFVSSDRILQSQVSEFALSGEMMMEEIYNIIIHVVTLNFYSKSTVMWTELYHYCLIFDQLTESGIRNALQRIKDVVKVRLPQQAMAQFEAIKISRKYFDLIEKVIRNESKAWNQGVVPAVELYEIELNENSDA